MTTITFGRQVVAVVATVLVSTACLLGAVGPAAMNGSGATVAVRTLA